MSDTPRPDDDLPFVPLPNLGEASMLIASHREGDLDVDMSAAIRRVAAAVATHEGRGWVNVRLTFTAKEGVTLMADKVTFEHPVPPTARPYHVDPDSGTLRAARVDQSVLPFGGTDEDPFKGF